MGVEGTPADLAWADGDAIPGKEVHNLLDFLRDTVQEEAGRMEL